MVSVYQFGISAASLLPWSMRSPLWPFGSPLRAAGWAADAGFDFYQVLPFRGVKGKEDWPLEVRYSEGAWNPINTLWDGLNHKIGGEGMPSTPKDWIFFPGVRKSKKLEILLPGMRISHRLFYPPCDIYEVNPDDGRSAIEIANYCDRKNRLAVVDTEHLIRDSRQRPGWSPFGETEAERLESIKILAPWVSVVHIKTTYHSPTEEILRLLFASQHMCDIDFIAEYRPILGMPAKVKKYMETFLQEMKECVNAASQP